MNAVHGDAGIIIGCGAVASAIAVHLHRRGFPVVMCEDVDPGFARRGMAFTDAWYVGNVELEGANAVFCSSVKSIPTVLTGQRQIAATTWSWQGVAAFLLPRFVIDVRESRTAAPARQANMESLVMLRVGAAGVDGHQVDRATPPDSSVDADEHIDLVLASRPGRFATAARIGQCVRSSETVGYLDREAICAPATGVLRGLPANGARIARGMALVEVDRRGDPILCFGIELSAWAVAQAVETTLAQVGIAGTVTVSTTTMPASSDRARRSVAEVTGLT